MWYVFIFVLRGTYIPRNQYQHIAQSDVNKMCNAICHRRSNSKSKMLERSKKEMEKRSGREKKVVWNVNNGWWKKKSSPHTHFQVASDRRNSGSIKKNGNPKPRKLNFKHWFVWHGELLRRYKFFYRNRCCRSLCHYNITVVGYLVRDATSDGMAWTV